MGIRDRTVSHYQGCSEPDSGVQHVESGDADCKRCGIGADAEPRSLHQLHCRRFSGTDVSDACGNISNLGSQWIYLLEGLLDLGAAAVLVFEKNVKAFFGK